jgi:hypothetical protein
MVSMLKDKPLLTFQDVTKRASVAPIIVSRVLKNLGDASEKTYQRVETAIKELGNVLSTLARRLGFKRTNTLALVITDGNEGKKSDLIILDTDLPGGMRNQGVDPIPQGGLANHEHSFDYLLLAG